MRKLSLRANESETMARSPREASRSSAKRSCMRRERGRDDDRDVPSRILRVGARSKD